MGQTDWGIDLRHHVKDQPVGWKRRHRNHQASILSFSATDYVSMVSVHVSYKTIHSLHVVMDTGPGYKVIHRDILPLHWKRYDIRNANVPTVGESNGNPPQIQNAVKLWIIFGDSLYRLPLIVAERLSCPVIVGTSSAINMWKQFGVLLDERSSTGEISPFSERWRRRSLGRILKALNNNSKRKFAPSPIMQNQVTSIQYSHGYGYAWL